MGGISREQGKLAPNAGTIGDLFGGSVVLDGHTIVVGDPDFFGTAYVYEGLVFTHMKRGTEGLKVSFATDPATSYEVESAESLIVPIQWQNITNVLGDGTIMNVPVSMDSSQRFYRVRLSQ
jgi:hypothetical protein